MRLTAVYYCPACRAATLEVDGKTPEWSEMNHKTSCGRIMTEKLEIRCLEPHKNAFIEGEQE